MKEQILLPQKSCIICDRSIEETGGRRLVGRSIFPFNDPNRDLRERIKRAVADGYKPWCCQLCANMVCKKCGSPYQRPMGYDCLSNDGGTYHVAIFPVNPGCINPSCENSRKVTPIKATKEKSKKLKLIEEIEKNTLPIPGGQKAYWITPYGRVIDIGKLAHVHYLILNNEEFGISESEIDLAHETYGEAIGVEGKARDELIIEALKKGWVTARFFGGHRSHWTVRVWDFDRYQVMSNIVCWAQEIVAQEGPHSDKYAPVHINDYKSGRKRKQKMKNIADGWLSVS